jgi:hypothetical protein
MQGEAVRTNSKFCAQIEAIAKTITGTLIAKPVSVQRARRFMEFFFVSPDRDRHRWTD